MMGMLAFDIDVCDALVDLSNVLRDTNLGGRGKADLIRLERVGQALSQLYGAAEIRLFAIADASLFDKNLFLDPRQLGMLRRWAERDLVRVAPKADGPLLTLAEQTGLPIITGDRFVGHRREFPWLDGSDDSILMPAIDTFGVVSLHHAMLAPMPDWKISRSEENDLLVQQGLRAHPDLLNRFWGCPEPRCARHDPRGSRYLLLPRWEGDRLFCDLHGVDMIDLGPRPRVAQLKIMYKGREQHRFPVPEHAPVVVGRGAEVSLTPWLEESLGRKVSRTHLVFTLADDRLTVTEQSRHGTFLIDHDGTRKRLHSATRPFGVGERLEILPGLEIIRSGRRFPAELAADRAVARPSEPRSAPTLSE